MVILDMAGTTIDEANAVYICMVNALAMHQIDTNLDFILLHAAGKDKKSAIRDVHQKLLNIIPDDTTVNAIYQSFENLLTDTYEKMPLTLMNGVSELLSFLKSHGIISVFNTGYPEKTARTILKKVGLETGLNRLFGYVGSGITFSASS
mgnify:CR=1 FL=1